MENRYAVMGKPISHSLSPMLHQLFAEQTGVKLEYSKILIDSWLFESRAHDFFAEGGSGLNITLPYKQRAFAMSSKVSARCMVAGAANTLWMKDGLLHADNTDGIGLVRDLRRFLDINEKRILVLGAGGAARGVIGPLLDESPLQLTVVNRTLQTALKLQSDFQHRVNVSSLDALHEVYDLIINATSTGMDGMSCIELPLDIIGRDTFCYDLAYKYCGETPFVAKARALGCNAVDGFGMLVEQAAEAFYIWHGIMPVTTRIIEKNR